MANSVMARYLGKAQASVAMDAAPWEESKHHRSDDGRFASSTGRGKGKSDADKDGGKNDKNADGRAEMSEEEASRIVRRAFEEAKCELKALKLVGHALNADVKEADEGTLDAINTNLTKHGLKAKISDKTTFKIAEDGYDDFQVMDDPMLEVLVDLCRIDMVAKDLHYRAKGKPFYGLHELADLVWSIGKTADELNEVYYMGEKQKDPPERAIVAAKAAQLVGNAGEGGEDRLIQMLAQICGETATAVETAKKGGVASGTAAVLDEISKDALQAKGLLVRTMKDSENNAANAAAIDKVIGKGFYIAPDAAAQDAGTSEGAKKGWESRRRGGSQISQQEANKGSGGAKLKQTELPLERATTLGRYSDRLAIFPCFRGVDKNALYKAVDKAEKKWPDGFPKYKLTANGEMWSDQIAAVSNELNKMGYKIDWD